MNETELRELLAYCRVDRDEVRRLLGLFHESRERGYLQFIEGSTLVPLRNLIEQERLANKITTWSLTYVPGLLQIASYIRVLMENSSIIKPPAYYDLIRMKLDRQVIFDRSREFLFYVHENALRLPVGGPDIMQAQLLHILTMNVRPYITIRVVPAAIGAHAGAAGSFVKLEYHKFEPAIWIESLRTGLFLEDKESLDDYDGVIKLLDKQALDAEASRKLISSIGSPGRVALAGLARE